MQQILDFLGISFHGASLPDGALITSAFNGPLVALSLILAITGSFVNLLSSKQIEDSNSRLDKIGWLMAGSVAMSGGVWSMHFIGMLALNEDGHMQFGAFMTILSAVPVFIVSVIVSLIMSNGNKSTANILGCGVLLGVGIGAMHFIGMAAMRETMVAVYEPSSLIFSITMAIGLAILALGAKVYVETHSGGRYSHWANAIGAAVMGIAVSGMHYTAITFAEFYHTNSHHDHGSTLDNASLIIFICGLVLVFLALISLVSVVRKINADKSLIDLIINNSKEGFLVCNSQGIIRLFSPGAEALFERSAEDVIGKSMDVILPWGMSQWHAKKVTEFSFIENKKAMLGDREVTAYTKDGRSFPMEVDVAKVGVGRDAVFCATMRDISSRKELQMDQAVAHEKLSAALEQQKSINQMQKDFVTMASHEFRTPLAIIDGGAQRILRRKSNISQEDLEKRIGNIRGAVKRMERLMESFLASAKTEGGDMHVKYEETDLARVITSVCDDLAMSNPTYEIVTNLSELPETLQCDPKLISQVIGNLVSNAIKYSPGQERVVVKGWESVGRVHVSVKDTGVGIPNDEIGKVYARYFRASTSTGIPGTGIGLNLAQHIIDLHGGGIAIESEVGIGSKFVVTLPSCPITSVDGLIDLAVNEADDAPKAVA